MFYHLKNLSNKAEKLATVALAYGITYLRLYPGIRDDISPASKELSERVNLQARQMGVKRPIKVYTSKSTFGQMSGVNGPGAWNSMAITLDQEVEKDHDRFIMSHEIAHAKNNDPLIVALIQLAWFHLSFLNIPIVFPLLGAWMGSVAYLRYAEKRADKTAAAYVKNIETAIAIKFFSKQKSEALDYRNSPSEQLWDDITKKLMISSTGDLLFQLTFPFVDTHPSNTSRIEYLTKFIEQRPDSDPIIEVFYQAGENGPLTPILLTNEQSSLLRQIIQSSPKNRLFNSLGKIVLCVGDSVGMVQLFDYGQSHFSPYHFELDVISNPDLLPAMIETIMYGPKISVVYIEAMNTGGMLEFKEKIRCELEIEADEQVHLIKVSNNPISESNRFIFYTGKQLSLTSNKCFEALDNTKKTGASP